MIPLQVAHESWCSAKTHYDNMKKTYLRSWEQSRRELLARVAAAFAEAGREYEAKKLAREERGRQLELCRELCEKVSCAGDVIDTVDREIFAVKNFLLITFSDEN